MKNDLEKSLDNRYEWYAPRLIMLTLNETQMKQRVTNFEGGNSPNNQCINMSHPNYDPTLDRCFRRGPS